MPPIVTCDNVMIAVIILDASSYRALSVALFQRLVFLCIPITAEYCRVFWVGLYRVLGRVASKHAQDAGAFRLA